MSISITCPICGATSHHPEDVRFGYCGQCHAFTRTCTIGGCQLPGAIVLGNVAACTPHAADIARAAEVGAG